MKTSPRSGKTGSTRRRNLTYLSVVGLMTLGLSTAGSFQANAVHDDGVFELDRNATDDAAAGEDWSTVCPSTVTGCTGGTAASVSSFVTEAANASIFTGGGSKDDLDITQWLHKNGSTPDKDDLAHGYAARYGDDLYFGADRFAATGDATVGVWFFQSDVAPIAGGTFSGQHRDGDILVLSDFTKGGETATIRVFQWNGPGGTITPDGTINGTLDLLYGTTAAPADCVGPPAIGANDPACATVNQASTPSPWAFTPKSGPAGSFPKGHFYEGGIDLAFLDLEDECFSSFLVETRSSQAVDATLKDFVGGSFASCRATMTTTPSVGAGATVVPGTMVTDSATIVGTGLTNPPTPTGDVTFFICGPIATGLCTTGGTNLGTGTLAETAAGTSTATSPSFDTAGKTPGRYCFRAEWPGDTNYDGSTHTGTGDSECFNIAKLPSSTLTGPVDGSGASVTTISLGGTVYDRAVVTGAAAGGDPTGNVSFFVCGPDLGVCTTGGSAVTGNPKALVSDGVAGTFTSSATSGAFTPTAPGQYCFRADYAGSAIYDPSSDSAANECFTVTQLPTGTVTTPSTAVPVVLGTAVSDTAVVSGSAPGGDPTGSVAFFVCGPTATAVSCATGGTALGSAALASDGVAGTFTSSATSASFTATAIGVYCFRAEYGGNVNYTGSSDSTAPGECFTVYADSSTTTAQDWLPNDSATITSTGNVALNGTVDITLHAGGICTGAVLYTEPQITLTGAASPSVSSTTNTTVKVTASTTVSWKTVFTSSDPFVNGSTHCESTALTITN